MEARKPRQWLKLYHNEKQKQQLICHKSMFLNALLLCDLWITFTPTQPPLTPLPPLNENRFPLKVDGGKFLKLFLENSVEITGGNPIRQPQKSNH